MEPINEVKDEESIDMDEESKSDESLENSEIDDDNESDEELDSEIESID